MDSTTLATSLELHKLLGDRTILKSTIFGIDSAKNIIQFCEISKHGELVSNKAVSRQKLNELLA